MLTRAALTLGCVLVAAPCIAQSGVPAEPKCPSISDQHRWLDDNSCLQEDSFPKRLASGPLEASFGGELRARFEATDALDFGIRDQRGENALLLRGLLHGDVRAGEAVRGFVQLGFTESNGRRGGSGPVDESGIDIQQAFVDVSTSLANGQSTLRVGRQELAFGSARIVGTREGPNVRLAFDGARASWVRGELRVDAIATRPVLSLPGDFDDRRDRATALYGVYVATAPPTGTGFDLYYLGYENDRAIFDSGPGRERRHSLGLRSFGKRDGWSWDVEGVYQFGAYGSRTIKAWTVASTFGRSFDALPWKPELGLSANIASGDDDPADDELNTFNPLFPKLPYFNEAAFGVPANFYDLRPSLTVAPRQGLTIEASADLFWRESTRDAVYTSPLVPTLRGASSGERRIGTAYQLRGDWEVTKGVTLLAALVRFEAGPFVRAAGGTDQTAFIASTRWRW